MDEVVSNVTTLENGRLGIVDPQDAIINRMLVDQDGDILSDDDGNILTE